MVRMGFKMFRVDDRYIIERWNKAAGERSSTPKSEHCRGRSLDEGWHRFTFDGRRK